ncbi:General secretion pathway protein K [hydrothermal vent metagenome]|uniref:General secretion pathway protein K n=1 Tax=hydrothermal vent metagenome TaxID=652676 RepID=A0A3B0ZRE5_9ZZZZ
MMQQRRIHKNQQAGIALIMVLLVVALVAIMAAGIASKQQLSTRRTGNLLNNEQAYMYLLGAEDWAKNILAQDFKDNKTDSFDDDWAVELPPIPVEGGTIQGKIKDLQARFNINNFLKAGNPDKDSIALFKNLLNENNIDIEVTDAIIDWLDENLDSTIPAGAEDGDYLNNAISYRAANRLMASASELIMVKGFDYKRYKKIAPYIIALPIFTPLNVNTASAMQISMLSNQISLVEAKNIISERNKSGYKSVDEFIKQDALKGKKITKIQLSVNSEYFLLQARSIIGSARSELYSVLYRDKNGKIKVLLRTQRRI